MGFYFRFYNIDHRTHRWFNHFYKFYLFHLSTSIFSPLPNYYKMGKGPTRTKFYCLSVWIIPHLTKFLPYRHISVLDSFTNFRRALIKFHVIKGIGTLSTCFQRSIFYFLIFLLKSRLYKRKYKNPGFISIFVFDIYKLSDLCLSVSYPRMV